MPSKPQLRWPTRDVMQTVDEAVATEPLQGRIADMPLNPKATPPEVEE